MKGIAFFLFAVLVAIPASSFDKVETYVIAADFWPPFRIESDTGDFVGIDKDILDEVAQRMDVQFVWHKRPWARCLSDLESGQSDLLTAMARTEERARYIEYAAVPYYSCSPVFYRLKGRLKKRIAAYDDLMGLSIGYVRDSAYFERFNKDATLNKVAGNTEDQLVRMLLERRFDVIVGTDCQVDYDLKQRGLTGQIVKTEYRPPHKTDLYIGFSKRSRFLARLDEFNQVLKDMLESGTIDAIIAKYTGNRGNENKKTDTDQ